MVTASGLSTTSFISCNFSSSSWTIFVLCTGSVFTSSFNSVLLLLSLLLWPSTVSVALGNCCCGNMSLSPTSVDCSTSLSPAAAGGVLSAGSFWSTPLLLGNCDTTSLSPDCVASCDDDLVSTGSAVTIATFCSCWFGCLIIALGVTAGCLATSLPLESPAALLTVCLNCCWTCSDSEIGLGVDRADDAGDVFFKLLVSTSFMVSGLTILIAFDCLAAVAGACGWMAWGCCCITFAWLCI